jgi:plastocyanin
MNKGLSLPILICILARGILFSGNIKGKVVTQGNMPVKNAVVYIDRIPGKIFMPPAEHAIMDQRNLKFIPHVLPVLVGTTVDFLNSDKVLHNVFTPDKCADKFNLGTWSRNEIRSYTFTRPCVVTILCNVHPEMEAYIIVLETPYFAVTDENGNFVIKNVPPGRYTLKVWHEKLKARGKRVVVPETGAINVYFKLKF